MGKSVVVRTVADIKSLRIQGASEVRKRAVEALVESVKESKAQSERGFRKEFLRDANILSMARPTEPELRTAIWIIKKSISQKGLSAKEMKQRVLKTAEKYEQDRKASLAQIASYGANLIKPHSTILTHCHSHSVIDVLIKAKRKIERVYCCEARPLYQGRMTARDLAAKGIEAVLIVDSAASTVAKKCDYFFTGADALLADGDLVNKIGTNQVSITCKRYAVPHYAVSSTHKFEPGSFFGKDEPIEQRSPQEVLEQKIHGVKVLNPAFDRTDSSLIEGIVCELGVFSPASFASQMYNRFDLAKHHKEFLRFP